MEKYQCVRRKFRDHKRVIYRVEILSSAIIECVSCLFHLLFDSFITERIDHFTRMWNFMQTFLQTTYIRANFERAKIYAKHYIRKKTECPKCNTCCET